MKIGVIGDAPAGPVLAKAWAAAGHELVGVFVEGPEAIGRVEALIPDVPIANMAAVVEDADLVLLAIPSNDIEITCAGLADLGLFGPKKIVVHLSPLKGYEALADAARFGAIPIALHPVMHFTGTSMDLTVLKNTSIKTNSKGEGFSAKLWSIDLTGYNEKMVETETDASDPSWSSLLSN